MYCTQWSRSAGFASGPFLSMMRRHASCVRIVMRANVCRASVPARCQSRVQRHRRLDRGLRVKLGRDS